jgi:16S rRNA (cytosine1402-N4)-methyltransferase
MLRRPGKDAVEFAHASVLARETVEALAVRPGALVVDGTLGGGGHASLLLERGARVIGLDRDPVALAAATTRLAPYGDRFVPVQANFRDIARVLENRNIPAIDGALVDLGVSSPQFDDPARGFSFRAAGPLDMRMGPDAEPLADYLARIDERELSRVIHEYGEERFARPIARRIKDNLAEIRDTSALAEIVSRAIPRKAWPPKIHPATRTFQALRIAVNDELGALADWLAAVPTLLVPGGRAAAISFHSLEDRAVKRAFEELTRPCRCPPELPVCTCGGPRFRAVTRKAVVASDEELARNPRARSAKLRAVERLQ